VISSYPSGLEAYTGVEKVMSYELKKRDSFLVTKDEFANIQYIGWTINLDPSVWCGLCCAVEVVQVEITQNTTAPPTPTRAGAKSY